MPSDSAATACAEAVIMLSVTRVARATVTPRPRPGNTNALFACAIRYVAPPYSTGANGLPVATSARPSVQRIRSAGTASALEVGLDSGMMIGRSSCGRHLPHDRLAERASLGGGADQHRWLHMCDDIGQRVSGPATRRGPGRQLASWTGIRHLEVEQLRGVRGQQALDAQRPDPASGFLWSEPLPHHLVTHHVGDTNSGGARAVNDHSLVAHRAPGGLDRSKNGGHYNCGGALHIVVEGAHVVRVLVQNAAGVAGAEILPVQHCVRKQLRGGTDVGVNQVVVALGTHPSVTVADVHLVIEQGQVVCAHVQHHGNHPPWVQTGRGDVDVKLAD